MLSTAVTTVDSNVLADQYRGGESIKALARRYGVGHATIRRRLIAAGVPRRPGRMAPKTANPAVSKVVRDLASSIESRNQSFLLKQAGVSEEFWRDARSGRRNPTLALVEALANAAGYELVLRRRAS